MLGVVVSVGARALPVLARAGAITGGIIENRINPIGLALAGALGIAVNERNQRAADGRHKEQLDQEERHHKEMMAQQAVHYQRIEQEIRNERYSVAAQIDGIRGDVRRLNGSVVDMNTHFAEANRELARIKLGVDKTSQAIDMCTRPQQAVPVHAPEPARR